MEESKIDFSIKKAENGYVVRITSGHKDATFWDTCYWVFSTQGEVLEFINQLLKNRVLTKEPS